MAETGRGFVSLLLFCFFIFLIKFITNRLNSPIFLVNCYMFIYANSPGYGTNRVTTSPDWNWSKSRHFCVLVWNLAYFLSKYSKWFLIIIRTPKYLCHFSSLTILFRQKSDFWEPVIPDQLGPEPPHATIGLTQGSMVDRLVGTAHAKEAIGSRFSM